ncbi:hypothetical protein [Maribacter spongiicola]|uniref:hypothetical protein n=1 Tax=Maribacter spongiicola TaxID=1206753 RepID=UPI003F966367
MAFLKRNYGWLIVAILAILPLFILSNMFKIDMTNGFHLSLVDNGGKEGLSTLEMLYHITGEFAIRWMTAVLTCTPFFILFGVTNLFVRQAMGHIQKQYADGNYAEVWFKTASISVSDAAVSNEGYFTKND